MCTTRNTLARALIAHTLDGKGFERLIAQLGSGDQAMIGESLNRLRTIADATDSRVDDHLVDLVSRYLGEIFDDGSLDDDFDFDPDHEMEPAGWTRW